MPELIKERLPTIRKAFESVERTDLLDAYLSTSKAGLGYPAMLHRLNDWLAARGEPLVEDESTDEAASRSASKRDNGNTTVIAAEKPSADDYLDRKPFVLMLARMFAGEKFPAHTTLGLLGDWGTGKSSVMLQLRDRLTKTHGKRFCFAEFNAWRYEKTDNLAAGLAQEVVQGLVAPLGFFAKLRLRWTFAWHAHPVPFLLRLGWVALLVVLILTAFGMVAVFGDDVIATIPNLSMLTGLPLTIAVLGLLAAAVKGLKEFAQLTSLAKHPLSPDLHRYMQLPDYADHLGELPAIRRNLEVMAKLRLLPGEQSGENTDKRGRFRRWLDTITARDVVDPSLNAKRQLVLFVDDVDRCNAESVVETLDAVRLVAEVPGVTVVVLVDSDIALQAVMHHYRDTVAAEDRPRVARDYLAKVLHTVVQLPPPEPAVVRNYVETHLFKDAIEREKQEAEDEESVVGAVEALTDRPSPPVPSTDINGGKVATSIDNDDTPSAPAPELRPPPVTDEDIDQAMQFTADERRAFRQCVEQFAFTNPRQIKRLQNGFGMLKGLEEAMDGLPRMVEGIDESSERMLATMFVAEFLAGLDVDVRKTCWKLLSGASVVWPGGPTPEQQAAIRIRDWLDENEAFGPRPPIDSEPPYDPYADNPDEVEAFIARWHAAKIVTMPPVPLGRGD
ncbi:MAG: P-loop NTPase fold protein [Planctomycetota bacterium]